MSWIMVFMKVLTWSATFAVMFGGALRLGPGSLRAVRDRPSLFLRTLVAVWVGVPVLTILVILALDVQGLGAATLLLMAFCPGVPLLLASTRTVRGALGTAFVALVLTAATEPLLIPYGTRIVSAMLPVDLTVQPVHILRVLVPTVFLPIALGFVIRSISPRVAHVAARVSDLVYVVGMVVTVIVVLTRATPLLGTVPPRTLLAAMVITIGDAVLGYWAGWPNRDDQKAIALAAALGNPALALAVVEVSYPGYPALALVTVYLLVRAIALAPFQWWMRRVRNRSNPNPPSGDRIAR